jgi:hypothetical protein
VITKDQAISRTTELLGTLGLKAADFQVEATADQWGAYSTASLVLDGVRSPLSFYVNYGAEGVMTSAGGFLAQPVRGDAYDLVGIETAVKRMNDPSGRWWGGFGGPMMARDAVMPAAVGAPSSASDTAAAEAGPVATAVTVSSGGGSSAGSTGSAVATPDTVVEPIPAPEPVPSESVPEEPTPIDTAPLTVTLTGVSAGYAELWATDGTIWLIPSYAFTSADGGQWVVYGIADQYLDFTSVDGSTGVVPDTMVGPTGAEVTVETAAAATTVVPVETGAPSGSGPTN